MKTNELTGPALDWAVAQCEGFDYFNHQNLAHITTSAHSWQPSEKWSQGGPIIEREKIATAWHITRWVAWRGVIEHPGPTPLIAAMRAYVASKMGDEVDVPGELCSMS